MRNLDPLFAALDGSDSEAKRCLLSDLAELLSRHAYGSKRGFTFNDPAIESLPISLEPGMIAEIARRVGPVLLDRKEGTYIRVMAAFVLGKTFDPKALATIARVVSSPETLPHDVGLQCGFSFDVLWQECGPGDPPVDLDAVEAGFKASGVP